MQRHDKKYDDEAMSLILSLLFNIVAWINDNIWSEQTMSLFVSKKKRIEND